MPDYEIKPLTVEVLEDVLTNKCCTDETRVVLQKRFWEIMRSGERNLNEVDTAVMLWGLFYD